MTSPDSFVLDYTETLERIYSSCVKDVGTVAGFASALCAIFALFYIGNIIWRSWCQGGSINIYAIFKPFCICLIIANFTIFTQVIDEVARLINKPTVMLVEKKRDSTNSKVENLEKVRDEQLKEITFWDDPSSWISAFYDKICGNITNGWVNIISLFGMIASLCVLTFGYVTKLILFYLGPFIFALSLIPYFSGGIGSWLGRYITVCLYAPCINIINFLLLNMYDCFLEKIEGEISSLYLVAFSIVSGICYITVPSIAGYVVSSTGAKELTQEGRHTGGKLKDPAKYVASKMAGKSGGKTASAVSSIKK